MRLVGASDNRRAGMRTSWDIGVWAPWVTRQRAAAVRGLCSYFSLVIDPWGSTEQLTAEPIPHCQLQRMLPEVCVMLHGLTGCKSQRQGTHLFVSLRMRSGPAWPKGQVVVAHALLCRRTVNSAAHVRDATD